MDKSELSEAERAKLHARAQALIKELGLSLKELTPLFRAANITPEQYMANPHEAWLEGKAHNQPIDPRRLVRLLEMRKRQRTSRSEG